MPVTVTMPDEEIARLAHELAARTGVSEIEAVRRALREMVEARERLMERSEQSTRRESVKSGDAREKIARLEIEIERLQAEIAQLRDENRRVKQTAVARRLQMMETISTITAAMPLLDDRPTDEILGHDEIIL